MKNAEKYKMASERAKAFEKFCHKNSGITDCHKCPLESLMPDCGDSRAQFAWLDLETEEEKPLPCPFCGGKTIVVGTQVYYVLCDDMCGYASQNRSTKADAIAAHNRVVKAVMAAKEKEVKNG